PYLPSRFTPSGYCAASPIIFLPRPTAARNSHILPHLLFFFAPKNRHFDRSRLRRFASGGAEEIRFSTCPAATAHLPLHRVLCDERDRRSLDQAKSSATSVSSSPSYPASSKPPPASAAATGPNPRPEP